MEKELERSNHLFQYRDDGGGDLDRMDVVITWVDDQTPGYREQLLSYAMGPADRDPARTRDNLDLLRYGLRSLERRAPWVNKVYLLTCRPQRPGWLADAHPRLTLVHHDEIMPAAMLPTFNSFAIISHLHLIPGLSEHFLYLEDDMLFLRDVSPADFRTSDGRYLVFEKSALAPRYDSLRNPASERPWNLALAETNRLLDEAYGPASRGEVNHVPLLISKRHWGAMTERFPQAFAITRQSRFRAAGNIAPEYLYPHMMLADGKAVRASPDVDRAASGYVPLEDFWPVTAFALWRVARRQPAWVTLNDNFGPTPNRTTLRFTRGFLSRVAPHPSSFERA